VRVAALILCLLAGASCLAALAWRPRGLDPADLVAQTLGSPGPPGARSARDAATQAEIQALKEEALEAALQLVDTYPGSAEALCVFGLVLSRCGNRAGAVRCWEQCLELCPGLADACHALGRDALQRGEHAEAVQWLRKALQTKAILPDALLTLAESLSGMGRLEEAIAVYGRHLDASPRSAEGWFRLGQAHLQLAQYEKAKECHQKALRLDSGCRVVYHSLALVCERLGQAEEAAKYRRQFASREAQDRMPADGRRHKYDDLAAMRRALAASHVAVGRVHAMYGGALAAESHWRKAVQASPQELEARLTLVALYESQGRWEEAIQVVEQAREIEPDNPLHLLKLGMLNVQLKRLDGAEAAFRRATELAPARPEGHVALAQLYAHQGRDLARAKQAARTAVGLQPTAANYSLLGTVYERCGELDEARRALERAIELDPGSPHYRDAYAAMQAKRQGSDRDGR